MTASQTSLIVRPVRPDEFEALGDICVAAYHSLPAEFSNQEAYDLRLRDVAHRATASCVLVAVGPAGELLGGVTYVSGPEDPYSEGLREGEAGIRMLAVSPAAQGRGAGRALVAECVAIARRTGRARVVLHTSPAMAPAIHLYESLGFSRRSDIDFSPVPGVHIIGYDLELTPPSM
jgi:ribosomal protein S18 acetylase RimI-like enzyme